MKKESLEKHPIISEVEESKNNDIEEENVLDISTEGLLIQELLQDEATKLKKKETSNVVVVSSNPV